MPSYKPKVPFKQLMSPMSDNSYGSYSDNDPLGAIAGKSLSTVGARKFDASFAGVTPRGSGLTMRSDLGSSSKQVDWKGIGDKVSSTMKDVQPFVSNIRNAFVKPPKPKMGSMNNFVSLKRVNMDADRNAISREVNANTTQAYRNMDANTAAAIGMQGLGTKLNAFSQISGQENNVNSTISNQETLTNAQIGQGNNATRDEFNDMNLQRDIAQQREQSANWANAGDKMTLIGNEKEKGRVELDKTRMLAHAYDNSGVLRRLRAKSKAAGEPDPLGKDYKDLQFKMGGKLPMKKLC